jgi:hypothetical protein
MGEAKNKQSRTQRLKQEHPYCCLCGGHNPTETVDHIPPLSLFNERRRPQGFEVPACKKCNEASRVADLIVAYIARIAFNETNIELEENKKFLRAIRKYAPKIRQELMPIKSLRDQLDIKRKYRKSGYNIPSNMLPIFYGDQTKRLIDFFCYKLTLGMYFNLTGKILSNQGVIWAKYAPKEEALHLPSFFDRYSGFYQHAPNAHPFTQGSWDTAGQFEYAHRYNSDEGIFLFRANLRKGLFVFGLVIENKQHSIDKKWISPSNLVAHFTE